MTGRDTDDQRAPGEDPFREWDAAYVLGSLEPADRRAFEDHLRTCDSCHAAGHAETPLSWSASRSARSA